MAEIKRDLISLPRSEMFIITHEHTLADVIRWLLLQTDIEEAYALLAKATEEGAVCPKADCDGRLEYFVENCSCHISPPCSACTASHMRCDTCGVEVN